MIIDGMYIFNCCVMVCSWAKSGPVSLVGCPSMNPLYNIMYMFVLKVCMI